jgi:hypothetical protein
MDGVMAVRFVKVVLRTMVALAMVPIGAASLHAQERAASPPRREHGFVTAGFGAQTRTAGFTDVRVVPLHAEDATFETRYRARGGTAFGLGGGARVWRGVWVGGAWASTSHRHDVAASASLPHPFRFNEPRTIEGSRGDLKREETSLHLQVMYRVRIASRVTVGVFAGPSWIRSTRSLVKEVRYDEAYPYDSAAFEGMSIVNASATGRTVGYGAAVSVEVVGPLSVGIEVRRAGVDVSFENPTGGTLRAAVGGTQALGGVVVRF